MRLRRPRRCPLKTPCFDLDDQQQAARDWFESLRDRICAAFEAIEREAGSDAAFTYTPWDRTDASGEPGGGGVRGQMTGKVFEKVGVNVSTVGGQFSPEFAKQHPRRRGGPAASSPPASAWSPTWPTRTSPRCT